jgi:hypothetical protein
MARLKIMRQQGSPWWASTEEERKLKDLYSIDKDKGKVMGYDIALLLQYNPVQLR